MEHHNQKVEMQAQSTWPHMPKIQHHTIVDSGLSIFKPVFHGRDLNGQPSTPKVPPWSSYLPQSKLVAAPAPSCPSWTSILESWHRAMHPSFFAEWHGPPQTLSTGKGGREVRQQCSQGIIKITHILTYMKCVPVFALSDKLTILTSETTSRFFHHS